MPLDMVQKYVTIWLHIIMTIPSPYKAIADDTRRQILDLLRNQNLTAGVIAGQFRLRRKRLSRPAVSKHLRILRQSRLVLVRKQGRERIYVLNPAPLREVDAWLKEYEMFLDQQLQSFKDYVEAQTEKEKANAKKS